MRKSPLTLLEVILAVSLAAILLGSLFSFLWGTLRANNRAYELRAEILSRHRFFLRLTHMASDRLKYEILDNPSRLLLKYENREDADPNFRGHLTSLLYVENGALLLATWSENGERVERLMEKAQSIDFKTVIKDKALKIVVNDVEFPLIL